MSFPGKSLEASAENTALGWTAHLDLSGRPGPKFLLTNGCLGQMNIHLFNGSTNGKYSILNRKLNEMLLLDFIIYAIRVNKRNDFSFWRQKKAKVWIEFIPLNWH